jgi:malonate decarboxylase gamma subunit
LGFTSTSPTKVGSWNKYPFCSCFVLKSDRLLATALAADTLIGLPGAEPAVMDLPSMARVTKLPLDRLKELAKTTPVFAPGLDHFAQTGAAAAIWDPKKPLDEQLEAAISDASPWDQRDRLGAERGGRLLAAKVAEQVIAAATGKHAAAA